MQSKKYSGVIIGATGAIGTQLLIELLKSEKWGRVVTLTRREYALPEDSGVKIEDEVKNGRLVKKIVDFEHIEKNKLDMEGCDIMFSCFGTTRKDAGGAEPFMHIDHDYNVNAAKVAKEAGILHYSLVSSVGADATSMFTYLKCKGLIEQHIKELQFDTFSIFRPGTLNRGDKARTNEKLVSWLSPTIPVAVVAHAMRIDAESQLEKGSVQGSCYVYGNNEIKKL